MKTLMPYMAQLEKDMAFSEYAENHIVKRAINNDDSAIRKFCHWDGKGMYTPNANSFLINLINRLYVMSSKFGHDKILNFIKNQMAAGKANYNEAQFWQAFSEIEILAYLCQSYTECIKNAEYEPFYNGSLKNTEAAFEYVSGAKLSIEIKTPIFTDLIIPREKVGIIQPNVLWSLDKREEYDSELRKNNFVHRDNSLAKIKSFIFSATQKFATIPQESEFNILALNYTLSPWNQIALDEPEALFLNPSSGILMQSPIVERYLFSPNKQGEKFSKNDLAKISAFIIYRTDSQAFLFSDWRYSTGNRILIPNPYAPEQNLQKLEELIGTKCRHVHPFLSDFSLFSHADSPGHTLDISFKKNLMRILGNNIGMKLFSLDE